MCVCVWCQEMWSNNIVITSLRLWLSKVWDLFHGLALRFNIHCIFRTIITFWGHHPQNLPASASAAVSVSLAGQTPISRLRLRLSWPRLRHNASHFGYYLDAYLDTLCSHKRLIGCCYRNLLRHEEAKHHITTHHKSQPKSLCLITVLSHLKLTHISQHLAETEVFN